MSLFGVDCFGRGGDVRVITAVDVYVTGSITHILLFSFSKNSIKNVKQIIIDSYDFTTVPLNILACVNYTINSFPLQIFPVG